MKNTFGQSVSVTLFGESHGKAVGAVIDALAPGVEISGERIARKLAKRAPQGENETARRENDRFEILSGVFNGKSTGSPIAILIPNEDLNSGDYEYGVARPSHADYAAFTKYHGFEDYRGGGHFSGRITAAIVAAGAIFETALENLNVRIGSHILRCGSATDREFENVEADLEWLSCAAAPILEAKSEKKINEVIAKAKAAGDSVGGSVQTGVIGLPAGLGEPWFDSVESVLSHALFSIGGIKGVEFGAGFEGCTWRGSKFNDALRMENGVVTTRTNHNGGINGGITNGMPLVFQCAVRPTPSIAQRQETVDFLHGTETDIEIHGRHDPAILRRVCPVIDSVTAFVLCDLLAQRYGTDVFTKGVGKCNTD